MESHGQHHASVPLRRDDEERELLQIDHHRHRQLQQEKDQEDEEEDLDMDDNHFDNVDSSGAPGASCSGNGEGGPAKAAKKTKIYKKSWCAEEDAQLRMLIELNGTSGKW
jgi:hypothetical protein